MCKKILIICSVIFSVSAFAGKQYAAPFWLGEYPTGYELTANISLKGKAFPNNMLTDTVMCEMSKGQVIHPWAQKTNFSYVAVSEITVYQILKDVSEFEASFKAGDIVEELTYLSEGFCLYRKQGLMNTVDMSCFGEGDARVKVIEKGNINQEVWFQATCKSGEKAWVSTEAFEKQAAGSFKEAQVTGYGEVYEP